MIILFKGVLYKTARISLKNVGDVIFSIQPHEAGYVVEYLIFNCLLIILIAQFCDENFV